MDPYLRCADRQFGFEHELNRRHHRRHADISADGSNHGYRTGHGYKRRRPDSKVFEEPDRRHSLFSGHLVRLLYVIAHQRCAFGVAGTNPTDHIRRADCLLRRFRRHHHHRLQIEGQHSARRSHSDGPDATPLHSGLRTGHPPMDFRVRCLLPVPDQHRLHRIRHLAWRTHSEHTEAQG